MGAEFLVHWYNKVAAPAASTLKLRLEPSYTAPAGPCGATRMTGDICAESKIVLIWAAVRALVKMAASSITPPKKSPSPLVSPREPMDHGASMTKAPPTDRKSVV